MATGRGADGVRTSNTATPLAATFLGDMGARVIKVEPTDIPPLGGDWPAARRELVPALDRSIEWTRKDYANQFFPIEGITRDHALASLTRFREILLGSLDATELELAIEREFDRQRSSRRVH